jgi:hypothetical protein
MGGADAVATTALDPTTVTVTDAVQLFASVTTKVYVPVDLLKTPVPVYGGVPPVAVTVTVAFPLVQVTEVALAAAANSGGCVMLNEALALQPFASVTVKVYVPAARRKLPTPLYGAVPPDAVTVTVVVSP